MKRYLVPISVVLLISGGIAYWQFASDSLESDTGRFGPFLNQLVNGEQLTFVAIGDSITAGTNSPRPYTALLEDGLRQRFPRAKIRAINSGVPGDTAEGGLRRVDRDVLGHKPDLVLIEFGWNDLKNGISAEDFETALRSMVEEIHGESSAAVYLMTTTHVNVVLSSWKVSSRNEIIRNVARDLNCGLIDLDRAFAIEVGSGVALLDLLSNDNLHPSETGQHLIARTVLHNWLGGEN